VSLSTRPALLYYSAMSLALAEILFKQTANSRLEKLREEHGAHGLVLKCAGNLKVTESFGSAATSLLAKPQLDKKGSPWGTFEVWRKSSRESPLFGLETVHHQAGGSSSGFRALMLGADLQPPTLPESGVTLLDCLKRLPQMANALAILGEPLELVRGKAATTYRANAATKTFELVVHPAPQELIDRFGARITFFPSANLDQVQITEFPSGYILRVEELLAGPPNLRGLPYTIARDSENLYFSCCDEYLNEFGLLYVALHICGNVARYYPDKWLDHVEHRSPLCIGIENLLEVATERLPLTSASEFTGTLLVPEA
jgi:hypothetical protein